jgi:hypothetical protein
MTKTKEEVAAVFDVYFAGLAAIYKHFGVETFAVYDYELQRNNDTWAVGGRGRGVLDTVYWQLPDEDCVDDYPEACHSGRLCGIYRKEFFTLIFTPSGMGGSGFAYLFDNSLENKNYSQ